MKGIQRGIESVFQRIEEQGVAFNADSYYREILKPLHLDQEELLVQISDNLHL